MIYSAAAAIDGIIERLSDELEGDPTVIATGGLAEKTPALHFRGL